MAGQEIAEGPRYFLFVRRRKILQKIVMIEEPR